VCIRLYSLAVAWFKPVWLGNYGTQELIRGVIKHGQNYADVLAAEDLSFHSYINAPGGDPGKCNAH